MRTQQKFYVGLKLNRKWNFRYFLRGVTPLCFRRRRRHADPMFTSFFLSKAPLPTSNRWSHCLSSSKSSLAGDENDGRYIHHCNCSFCCHVVAVVVKLVFVLVLMLVVALVPVLLFYQIILNLA